LDKLISQPAENRWLEFKQNKCITNQEIGEYISAMSNGATLANEPFGYIVWGIKDITRAIIGTNFSFIHAKEGNQDLELWLRKLLTPSIKFEIYEFDYNDNKIVLVQIPSAKGEPTYFKQKGYVRVGENKTNLNDFPEYIRQIYNSMEDWSAAVIENATINDLSPEAILEARNQYADKNPKLRNDIEQWDDITFLNKAKVLIGGRITRAAILLLGKPESEHFISPAVAKISWILKDKDNVEKDYQHFACPYLLEIKNVYSKIRNLKYRYLREGTLFPDEVVQYEPYIIREALNNCIAHQDYSLAGKINVIEKEDSTLTFVNSGSFIPQSVEKVIENDSPETIYRNAFLANAMLSFNMIDTIGSGIRKMFILQKNKFFPLPEYDFSNQQVKVQIIGKVVDINYAQKLVQTPDLGLHEIMLLDKVAKSKPLNSDEIKFMRKKKLIEGRKPNFHISAYIAASTDEKAAYIKNRAFDDSYYKDIIIEFLKKYKQASRQDINELILDKLSDTLNNQQKTIKINNLISNMSNKDCTIYNDSKAKKTSKWKLQN
jgi:ATP-dependent DNA helicase RecG